MVFRATDLESVEGCMDESQTDSWLVIFKDERAPNEQRKYDNEFEANKAAASFATTRQRRAYVYHNGLSCWYHDGRRHLD